MKARTIALTVLMVAAAVAAQTVPPSQKVAPAAKPAAAAPAVAKPAAPAAKPVAAPAAQSPFAKPAPAKAAAPAAKPVQPAVSKTAKPAKPAKAAVKKAVAKQPATTVAKAKPKGKRDPFLNPIVKAEGPGACATGKKCLAIDTIVLKGIVKSQVGMIAVVESSSRKLSYFLRENDPVFNGYVVKITRDSVVFRENVMDNLGRQSTREVVKKVVAPVV